MKKTTLAVIGTILLIIISLFVFLSQKDEPIAWERYKYNGVCWSLELPENLGFNQIPSDFNPRDPQCEQMSFTLKNDEVRIKITRYLKHPENEPGAVVPRVPYGKMKDDNTYTRVTDGDKKLLDGKEIYRTYHNYDQIYYFSLDKETQDLNMVMDVFHYKNETFDGLMIFLDFLEEDLSPEKRAKYIILTDHIVMSMQDLIPEIEQYSEEHGEDMSNKVIFDEPFRREELDFKNM